MNSLQTLVGLGKQSSKTSYATTFWGTRGLSVTAVPRITEISNENHMIGASTRSSAQQSVPVRAGFASPMEATLAFYPNSLGAILLGLGFTATKTGTPVVTHIFTKAVADSAPYLTGLVRMGSGADILTRQLKALRLSEARFDFGRMSMTAAISGLALDEKEGTGSETVTPEVDQMFAPFTGSMAFGAIATVGNPLTHQMTISRAIEEDDFSLHSYQLNDNLETSFAVSGVMQGVMLTANMYKNLVYGSTNGTTPSGVTLTDSLTFSFASPANITGQVVPYSVSFAFLKVAVTLANFQASGNNTVRADVAWRMIDAVSSAPITVTLANEVVSY